MEFFIYIALAVCPLMGGIILWLSTLSNAAKITTCGIWLVFLGFVALGSWVGFTGFFPLEGAGFRIHSLGLMLSSFILFVSGIVHLFSIRYMFGDRNFNAFFLKLSLLTSSLLLLIGADHLILMLIFWISSNLLLGSLMIHKNQWPAARNGGVLMIKYSLLGTSFFVLATGILAFFCHTFSLHEILGKSTLISYPFKIAALFCLMIAALTQSGVWPFHKWLLSSLNSPTPVSGMMHAGLVNGGGLLLTRFAPMFTEDPLSLHILFILGLISVILGTAWKLLQNNIKAMLACSTIAQMGFMLMQCGLGLFPAAIAHLCWHGLFKCYLFLNSGSVIQEKRDGSFSPKSLWRYLTAFLVGFAGAYGFGLSIGFSFDSLTTKMMLIVFAWLASAQIAYSLLDKGGFLLRILIASVGSLLFGLIYGWTVHLIEWLAFPIAIAPQPIHAIHIFGTVIVLLISVGVNMNLVGLLSSKRLYMKMLNMSQSNPKTMTLVRNEYKF